MIDGGANYVNVLYSRLVHTRHSRVFEVLYSQIGRTEMEWYYMGGEDLSKFRYLESVGGRIRSIPGRDMGTPVTNYEVEVQNDAKVLSVSSNQNFYQHLARTQDSHEV